MKKAKLLAVLSFAGIAGSLLAGCQSAEPAPKDHVHSYSELHSAVAATCTEAGKKAYYDCTGCDKVFDENKNETTADALVVAATGHTMVHHDETASTCVEHGHVEYYECSVCHDKFSDAEGKNKISETEKALAAHSGVKQDGKAPTCTEPGWREYYQCSKCKAYFEDLACTKVIEHIAPWKDEGGAGYLAPVGHDMAHIDGDPATCKEDGYKECYFCEECGKYYEDVAGTKLIGDKAAWEAWIVGAGKLAKEDAAHVPGTPVEENRVEPTCTDKGSYDEVVYCDLCDVEISRTEKEIEALGHHMTPVDGLDPTCSTAGYKASYYCDRCEKYFEDEAGNTAIGNIAAYEIWKAEGGAGYRAPAAHSAQHVNGLAATCESAGYLDCWQCEDCDAYFEDEACTTPIANYNDWKTSGNGYLAPKGHDAELTEIPQVDAKCEESGVKAYYKCESCGKFFEDSTAETEIGDADALAEWKSSTGNGYIAPKGHAATLTHHDGTAETCTSAGNKEYWECPDCGLFFSDSSAENKIGDADALAAWKADGGKVDPHAHTYGDLVPQVDALRENAGMKAHYQCSECEGYFDADKNATTESALVIPAPAKHFEAATNMNFDFEEPIALTETIIIDVKFIDAVEGSHINIALLGEKEGGGSDWDNYLGYFEINEDSVATNAGVSVDTITDDGYLRITINLSEVDRVNHAKPATPSFTAINGLFVRGAWSNVEGYIEVNSSVKDHQGFGDWIPQVDPYHDIPGVKAHYECTGCDHHFDASYKMFDSRIAPSAFHYDPTHDPTLFYGALETPAALDHEIALFDVKFDDPDTHQEIGFSMYDGSWAEHTAVYWLDCDSNGVYFEGVYDGISVHMMEDGYYRVFADLARIDPKACAQITHLYIQFPNRASNRGSGYLDVLPTYNDSDKVSEGELFNKYKVDTRIYIEPAPIATSLVYVDVKFFSENTADHINVGYYQDSSNYYGTYTMSPDGSGDVKNMFDLGNGYYRFIYDLSETNWKKNGTPETINYIQINQKWSTSNALVKAGMLPYTDVFMGGSDLAKTLDTPAKIATDTIHLDVKFESAAADSKISFRMDQDDSNYIWNYNLTPTMTTGDKAGITVTQLEGGVIRYSFKLSDLTNTPTGSPTVINKVNIRGIWSTGFGYFNISTEVGNNWQSFTESAFVNLPKEYTNEDVFGKALSFNYKLEGASAHSDYAHVVLMNDLGGAWNNISGEIDLFGDATTNKGGVVTALADGWYNVRIDTAKFNGDGGRRDVISRFYVNKLAGNVTKLTIDWDSFGFVDFERSTTKGSVGFEAKCLNGIENWRSSGKQLEFVFSFTTNQGGYKHEFALKAGSDIVGKFNVRADNKSLNHGGNNDPYQLLEDLGDGKYKAVAKLSEIDIVNSGTGTETITSIVSGDIYYDIKVYSFSLTDVENPNLYHVSEGQTTKINLSEPVTVESGKKIRMAFTNYVKGGDDLGFYLLEDPAIDAIEGTTKGFGKICIEAANADHDNACWVWQWSDSSYTAGVTVIEAGSNYITIECDISLMGSHGGLDTAGVTSISCVYFQGHIMVASADVEITIVD